MINRIVETYPPAKLNLFLEVLGKRADGFHELDTVMMAIDLRDSMRVELTEESVVDLECRWMPSEAVWCWHLVNDRLNDGKRTKSLELPAPEHNLVYRALVRFKEKIDVTPGFRVILEKHIPAGAGMGGASSDAASVLLAAAKLCGIEQSDSRIVELAAELGSDVPFFLGVNSGISCQPVVTGGLARARGRGEILENLTSTSSRHFVIVYPPEGLSTAEVFKNCRPAAEPRNASSLVSALGGAATSEQLAGLFFNRLTAPARRLSQWIDHTLDAIRAAGLRGGMMTGSGSACFAIASSAIVARRTARRLACKRLGICFATKSVSLPAPIRFLT